VGENYKLLNLLRKLFGVREIQVERCQEQVLVPVTITRNLRVRSEGARGDDTARPLPRHAGFLRCRPLSKSSSSHGSLTGSFRPVSTVLDGAKYLVLNLLKVGSTRCCGSGLAASVGASAMAMGSGPAVCPSQHRPVGLGHEGPQQLARGLVLLRGVMWSTSKNSCRNVG
jgi:hypothetical protein